MNFTGKETLIIQPIYKEFKNNFTYEIWIKPEATHKIDLQSTAGTSGITGQRYVIGPCHGENNDYAGTGISVGRNGISVYEHTANHLPATLVYKTGITDWTHIAVVYMEKVPVLYINGRLKKVGLRSPKNYVVPSGILGGLAHYGYFVGQLKEVRIWNYARNSKEIKADMNKNLFGNEHGLVGYWRSNKFYNNTVLHTRRSNFHLEQNSSLPTQQMNTMQKSSNKNFTVSKYQIEKKKIYNEPLVSIIVPNYNHSDFLRQRLDSIYNQTYLNFEVLLMDDCSHDNSREILKEYYDRYPEKTRLIFNEENSGGVFFQWEKGLSLAKGELIWIAESDDWCTNNFLDELTKSFQDEAVMLAYCQTKFMNENGKSQIWTIQEYLNDIDTKLWNNPFIMSAHQITDYAWSIKNIVPNVSSALFKKPVQLDLLKDEVWKSMRVCGDWALYIHLIQGGLVSYTTKATNYFRMHKKNTSVVNNKTDEYYREHEIVAKYVRKIYKVSNDSLIKQTEVLKEHWTKTRGIFSNSEFRNLYNVESIKNAGKNRKPNILMAGYSFSAGGGETFPIFLANILKDEGYTVTFLCYDQEERENGIKNMLRKDIPIVNNVLSINSIIDDFGIDIIHSHHGTVDSSIMNSLPSNLNYSHVVTLHGWYETNDIKVLEKILPRLLSRTNKIIYTADKNLDPFKKLNLYTPAKFYKIGNAFHYNKISPVNFEEFGVPSDAFTICLVSRAIVEKGWEEAIEAVKEARKISGQNIHLILIGNGPEYYRLKYSAPEFIHFLGFRDNIQNFFAAADLGFLPSRFKGESFPLVVIACLQAGKPVLASDIGEIASMLHTQEGAAGSIFPLEQGRIPVKQVAENISRYATDQSFYLEKLNQVQSAAEKFSTKNLFSSYDKVYQDVFIQSGRGLL